MTRIGLTLVAFVLVAATAACLDDSITGTRTLGLTLSSDLTTAAAGENITFGYDAQGTQLRRVYMDFGDGMADSTTFEGTALEASGQFVHSYAIAGMYVVRGRAVAQAGTATDSVMVTIN